MSCPKISDFLRTKSYKWRIAYLISRCCLDILPSLFVIISLSVYMNGDTDEFSDNNADVAIYFFECLTFISLVRLQWEYELPFLGSQYGVRSGGIKTSFIGISLERLTEWRNRYIIYFCLYKTCFSIRMLTDGQDLMLVNSVFDYMFQYILMLIWLITRSLYIKFFGGSIL